ncbi:MAG: HlyD family efflux transporter periplasmic adaptor subunit [Cyanobacteriota bacterium]|nr:HlyD family efflux transporter periplasmic adaptor subunit [Cyanobacteriota bacterium]
MPEESEVQPKTLFFPRYRWWLLGGLACIALVGAGVASFKQEPQAAQTPQSPAKVPVPTKITALGRLEPQGEVFAVSSSGTGNNSDRVAHVLVEEGSQVNAGQVIAVLDSRDRLQAVFEKAKGEVESLDAQLKGEKAVQKATIDRLNANLRVSRKDCQRYEILFKAGAVSAQERDSFCLQAETAADSLEEGKANLTRIVTTGEERLITAKAAQKQAYAELMLSYVRAPKSGEILKIHTKAGELIGSSGIIEMGQTNQMYAVAEVYETDITKVKQGQEAIVTSEALSDDLQGEVVKIGRLVRQQKILDPNPTADSDARIVEVKIRLDPASSDKAKGLTNQRIRAVIII